MVILSVDTFINSQKDNFLNETNLHSSIITSPEPALEELDADDGEHEEEEDGDEEDVPNVLHSDDHTLHHVLQTLCSVDRSAKEEGFK